MSDNPTGKLLSIDRIEGDMAVLVDENSQADIPLHWLPPGCSEGTALRLILNVSPDDKAALESRVRSLQSRFIKKTMKTS